MQIASSDSDTKNVLLENIMLANWHHMMAPDLRRTLTTVKSSKKLTLQIIYSGRFNNEYAIFNANIILLNIS